MNLSMNREQERRTGVKRVYKLDPIRTRPAGGIHKNPDGTRRTKAEKKALKMYKKEKRHYFLLRMGFREL